jgi:hypothetical protein
MGQRLSYEDKAKVLKYARDLLAKKRRTPAMRDQEEAKLRNRVESKMRAIQKRKSAKKKKGARK